MAEHPQSKSTGGFNQPDQPCRFFLYSLERARSLCALRRHRDPVPARQRRDHQPAPPPRALQDLPAVRPPRPRRRLPRLRTEQRPLPPLGDNSGLGRTGNPGLD